MLDVRRADPDPDLTSVLISDCNSNPTPVPRCMLSLPGLSTGWKATVIARIVHMMRHRVQVSLADAAAGGLECSPSNLSKRSASGAVRIGSSATASAASSPGAVAQQVSVETR